MLVPVDAPLSAPVLRRALIAGARRVIAGREELNRINVFPVADGDTGNNLASTMGSVLNGALMRRSAHAGQLLLDVGEDALDGARGNSGAILAQFFHGVAEQAGGCVVLDGDALAAAVRNGASSARAALARPVEGTILSVVTAFSDGAGGEDGCGPRARFRRGLRLARSALADTPGQLAVLRKAGVVDAGAKGFVDLLEGISEFMEGGVQPAASIGRTGDGLAMPVHDAHDADPTRRWCSECLVLGIDLDRSALGAALHAIGADSIVVAGGGARVRVHAHAADPQALFDACALYGRVESMKADDMLGQQRNAASSQRLAIVTDSAADLPQAILERHCISVVPARVELDGREYLDKVGLSTSVFYQRMASSLQLPMTSQPPPGDFVRQFELSLSHHERVLYVGLSRAVSGTLQSAERAAARDPQGRVQVFDTFNAASGQALMVWRAAEMAQEGAGHEDITRELERLRPLTRLWAITPDISHVVRGGRIPRWAGPLANFSALTPLARMGEDGRMKVCGVLFTRARAAEVFARRVANKLVGPWRWRVLVGHCAAPAAGQQLLDSLRARIDISESFLVETGAAVGAHAGPGALIVAVQPEPGA